MKDPAVRSPADGPQTRNPAPSISCEGRPATTAVPLRRLNLAQYKNTIRDLFRGLVRPSASFPEPTRGLGYTTLAEANVVTELGALQSIDAAEDVAADVVARLPRLLPCTPRADEACAQTFIDTYGRRAFRRPLRAEERALLLEVYRTSRADTPFAESVGLVAETMLSMPQFLYLVEEERPSLGGRLSAFELATRLAYLLSNTTPDDPLLAAAESGALDDAAGLEREARRLLSSERASEVFTSFFREWLDLGDFAGMSKDRSQFPEWNARLAVSMTEEIDRFVASIIRDEGGSLTAFLTSPRTYVNQPLAALYGLDPTISSGPGDWKPVTLDPTKRAGILTKPAFLASKAHASTTSPIFRGKFVRTQLLCDAIPPPPADAQALAPEFPPNATQREKSAILIAQPSCGGCHVYMNPIGLGFERFDALGKWRMTEEDGRVIDDTGRVESGPFSDFDGAVDLGAKLASSDRVRACFVKHWFRYAYGKNEVAADRCALEALGRSFSGDSVSDLLLALAGSEAFSHRAGGAE